MARYSKSLIEYLIVHVIPNSRVVDSNDDDTLTVEYDCGLGVNIINVHLLDYEKACDKMTSTQFADHVIEQTTHEYINAQYD